MRGVSFWYCSVDNLMSCACVENGGKNCQMRFLNSNWVVFKSVFNSWTTLHMFFPQAIPILPMMVSRQDLILNMYIYILYMNIYKYTTR